MANSSPPATISSKSQPPLSQPSTDRSRIFAESGLAWQLLPFLLLVVIWQAVASTGFFPQYLFPGPSKVLETFYNSAVNSSSLQNHLLASLIRVILGYIPGLGGGLILGILMGLNARVASFFNGPIKFFNAVPALAWIPIAILWFGIGYGSVTFIIFLSVFFPVLFNTLNGIRTIPRQYVNVAVMCEASRIQIIRHVLIPGALPSIITGIRIGAAYGWRGMIGAEMIASSSGLGFMMLEARQYLETNVVIMGMITIGVVWLIIDRLFLRSLEKATVERWGMVQTAS